MSFSRGLEASPLVSILSDYASDCQQIWDTESDIKESKMSDVT